MRPIDGIRGKPQVSEEEARRIREAAKKEAEVVRKIIDTTHYKDQDEVKKVIEGIKWN